jgi:hypothetical protein
VRRMGVPGGLLLTAGSQPLQPELADRFQHPEPRLGSLRLLRRSRLASRSAVTPSRTEGGIGVRGGPSSGGSAARSPTRSAASRVKTADEDGQAAEEHALVLPEQVVAPGDGVAHGAEPRRCVAWPPSQDR